MLNVKVYGSTIRKRLFVTVPQRKPLLSKKDHGITA